MEQRFAFEAVADDYDRYRPGYPDQLFADLAAEAGVTSASRILEVGCGAGQATRGLASLGAPLLAIDPGAALLHAAANRVGRAPHVAFEQATFEAWPLQAEAFDVVAAAQAWHWIDPGIRFEKAAMALRPGGVLAVMGNVPMPASEALIAAIEPLYRRLAPHLWGPPPEAWYLPTGPLPELFPTAQRFGPVQRRAYPYSRDLDRAAFEGLHRSYSYYQALPEDVREELIGGVADIIDRGGFSYRMDYEAQLWTARRVR